MSNNIHGKEQVEEITKVWHDLTKEISNTVNVLTEYKKTASKLPSDFINNTNKIKEAQKGYNKAALEAINTTTKLTAEQKEAARIERALITSKAKLIASTSKEAQELQKVRFETAENNKKTKQAAILSSALASEYQKLVVKMNQAATTVQNLNAKRLQGKKLSDVEQAELKQSTAQFNKYQTAVLKADASIGRFQRNVGNYPKGLRAAAGAARSLASAMGLLGGAFLIVQTIRGAISTIREFDRKIIDVKKTTNLSTEEIKLFKEEVIDLGLKTKGVSIQGLLQSSEVAGQLGVKGRANILKFSKTIEQLKLTSDIAGEASVRNFAKFIEVSEDTVENADKLGSVITELGNNFATTESQILSNATEIQKGLSIYDASAEGVLGLGAATSALGNEAEVSSGALQKTFKILNDGASSGKNLQKILEVTGQTAEEFREEFGRDSVNVFRKFIKGLSDTEKEGKNLSNTMTELGINNLRTTRVVGSLAKNYDILDDALNRANKEYVENNALTDEANEAAKSLDSQIGDLSDSWDGFILSLDGSEGTITKIFSKIIGFLGSVLEGIRLVNLGAKGREGELLANLTSNAQEKELKELNENVEKFGTTLEHEAEISKANSEAKIKQIKDEIAANDVLIAQKEKIFDGSLNVTERSDLDDRIKEAEKAQIGLNRNLATYNGALAAANILLGENTTDTNENTGAIDENAKAEDKYTLSRNKGNASRKKEEALLKSLLDYYERIKKTRESVDDLLSPYAEIEVPDISEELQKKVDENPIKIKVDTGLSDEEFEILNASFQRLGDTYGIDASKFTALFDSKENTVADYVSATGEAMKGLYSLFANNYEADLEKHRASAELALRFTEGNAEAQAEIREQLAEREKNIRRKQAEEEKNAQLFSAIINTAAAVVEALPNVPLAIAVGLLGAAEIAFIASQPVPQFFDGTMNAPKDTLATIDEKGAEIHTDKYGKVKSFGQDKGARFTKVSKGDKIYTASQSKKIKEQFGFQKELNSMLNFNGILPERTPMIPEINIESNGLSKEEFNNGINALKKTIDSKETAILNIDKSGFRTFTKLQNARIEKLNNRSRIKGKGV